MATDGEARAAGIRAARQRGVQVGRPRKDPDLAVRKVVRKERAAGKSLAQIADALTAKGISTPRGGAVWTKPSVQNVVQWMQENGELPSDNAA